MTKISIHALRVEGDGIPQQDLYKMVEISIHALRVEGDYTKSKSSKLQSISIHALRVEGDYRSAVKLYAIDNFYPRPPGGGRHDQFRRACA